MEFKMEPIRCDSCLESKVEKAIKILRMPRCEVEISYSGGKDSDVILELAKMAGIQYRAIYKCTTIDPPGTIAHCKAMGAEIIRPKESFFELIERKGFPTRRARFCCEKLKEYKVMDTAVQGIRRCESSARSKRYTEPIVCRNYSKGGHCNVILPIIDWTDRDVDAFIKMRHIKCAPVYYDDEGGFHVERRLGCLGCPMASDNGLSDFVKYPHLVKAWCLHGQRFLDSHPNSGSSQKFGDVYRLFVHNVFFHTYETFSLATTGFWRETDCKSFLEDFFKIKF